MEQNSHFCRCCLSTSSSCDSVESFTGSVNSRATERDWDNGSTASSTTAKTEYTGEGSDTLMVLTNYDGRSGPAVATHLSDDMMHSC